MTNLHHNTIKAAEKKGYIIGISDGSICARWPEYNVEMWHTSSGSALAKSMEAFMGLRREYEELSVTQDLHGKNPNQFYLEIKDYEGLGTDIIDAWEQIMDAVELSGEDLTILDNEKESGPTIVGRKYKEKYRENPRGVDNGDFVANMVAMFCVIGGKGRDVLDVPAFINLLVINGIEDAEIRAAKYANNGLMRMSLGLMLRKAVATNEGMRAPKGTSAKIKKMYNLI